MEKVALDENWTQLNLSTNAPYTIVQANDTYAVLIEVAQEQPTGNGGIRISREFPESLIKYNHDGRKLWARSVTKSVTSVVVL